MRQPHHTRNMRQTELLTDDWNTMIVPQLPADLDAQAKAHGALVRRRAFACASDLLRGLLAHVVISTSLRHTGAWGVLADVADLSAPAWLQRLRAANAFLLWLLGALLATPSPPRTVGQRVRRMRFVDATMLGIPGGSGDDWRLHTGYDFLVGRISDVTLTDRQGGEHLGHYALLRDDLILADGGYASRANLGLLVDAGAHGLIRIYPSTFPLETARGRRFDPQHWLQQRGPERRSQLLWCVTPTGRRIPVRLLAQQLTEEGRRAACRRIRARASRRGRTPSPEALFFAGWVLLITTLTDSATWADDELWQLYAARWQIERLFKRMKQLLRLNSIRAVTVASAEPYIRALLVAWVLHEAESNTLRPILAAAAAPAPATLPGQFPAAEAVVSTWVVTALVLDAYRQAIRGPWGLAQIRANLARLQRYLVSHPRGDRQHQETEVRAWLSGVRRTRRKPLPDAV